MRWTGILVLALAACAPGDAASPEASAKKAVAPARTTPAGLVFATTDSTGFETLRTPRPGEWRAEHPEPGQPFPRYVRSDPVRAARGEVLAFLPFGPFAADERRVLDRTVAFASIWFALDTVVLPDRPLPEGADRVHWGRRQVHTVPFLRGILPRARPDNAVCLFGVTMTDLYPHHTWNFVFGEATLAGRVGIWSFARFFDRFRGREETDASRQRALRRACALVVHEAGHAFGIEHCIRFRCVMNGSNSLAEADRQPLRLCPDCLRKLQWNRSFDVLDRFGKLETFCTRHGLTDEAAWIRRRSAAVLAAR